MLSTMHWPSVTGLHPSLPAHCAPSTDFLLRFSSTFHVCVPTPLAFVSNAFGAISIVAWLFAQLPQIYKNWTVSSTAGLSIFFLVEWCLGDLANLLGALFTHQAPWQVTIAGYYVFVDLCLVAQWIWYEKVKHHGRLASVWAKNHRGSDDEHSGGSSAEVQGDSNRDLDFPNGTESHNIAHQPSRPRIIFRAPTFDDAARAREEKPSLSNSSVSGTTSIYRIGAQSSMPSPSPRTVLLIACLIAIVHASPMSSPSTDYNPSGLHGKNDIPTTLEDVGTILSWLSTVLYLGSRLPQLLKNWRRKSTAGLSPQLFLAAFCGNLFYSAALATNPSAWFDMKPYGGHGWAGPEGNDRGQWIAAALPFFLGAAGVLGLDASVGVQFLLYGQKEDEVKVVVIHDGPGSDRHWRRVSGWMRGWIPSKSSEESVSGEDEALVRSDNGYGTF